MICMEQAPLAYSKQLQIKQKLREEDILYQAGDWNKAYVFVQPLKWSATTKFHFPFVHQERIERRAQTENYEHFVRTMADMVQKYAPELMREMGER